MYLYPVSVGYTIYDSIDHSVLYTSYDSIDHSVLYTSYDSIDHSVLYTSMKIKKDTEEKIALP